MIDNIRSKVSSRSRYIPVDKEELTVLEMIDRITDTTEEVVNATNGVLKDIDDKVSKVDLKVNRKLMENGDFRGTWWGIERPSQMQGLESAVLDKVFKTMNELVVYMPEPSTKEENTRNLQSLLDLGLNKVNHVTVRFNSGTYELGECYIHANTTIEMTNNTYLKSMDSLLFMNARRDIDNNFTVYNGNGDIVIRGGNIEGHFLSFIHGQNILIENVNLSKCNTSHYIELCACKNVTIKNCTFNGMDDALAADYSEYIQIDICTYKAFPRFAEDSICFDLTPNENIEIINCDFKKCCSHNFLGVAVGSHSWDTNHPKHKNITIKNCTVEGATYGAFRVYNWDNATIEQCKTLNCVKDIVISQPSAATKTTTGALTIKANTFNGATGNVIFGVCGLEGSNGGKIIISDNIMNMEGNNDIINIKYADNLIIKNNVTDGGKRLGNIAYSSNVNITKNEVSHIETYGLSIVTCTNVKVIDNDFKDSVMLANSTRVINATGCNVLKIVNNSINNIRGIDKYYAVAVYNSSNVIADANNYIKCDNNHDKQIYLSGSELLSVPYSKINKNIIFNGTGDSGTLTLLEDITKYKNLVVTTGAVSEGTFVTSFVSSFYNQYFSPSEHNKVCILTANGKVKFEVTGSKSIKILSADDSIRQIYGVEE